MRTIIRFVFWDIGSNDVRQVSHLREYEYGLTKSGKFPAELQDAFETMVEVRGRADEDCTISIYKAPDSKINPGTVMLNGKIWPNPKA